MNNITDFPIDKRMVQMMVSDFQTAKPNLRCRLVNTERIERIEDLPHREMDDLSLIYTILLEENEGRHANLIVTESVREQLGVTEEQLYEQSLKNMESADPAVINGMGEVLADAGMEGMPCPVEENLFVVSNTSRIHGAAAILCRTMDALIREKIGDYYILPSSVHEVLVVPRDGFNDVETLKQMVMEVNRNCLEPAEFLSDNVYEMRDGRLRIAGSESVSEDIRKAV